MRLQTPVWVDDGEVESQALTENEFGFKDALNRYFLYLGLFQFGYILVDLDPNALDL